MLKIKILIVGAGSWGTAVAKLIAENNPEVLVKIWARNKSVINSINEMRENNLYLPQTKLPQNITATNNLKDSITESKIILLATPSKAVNETCSKIAKYISPDSHFGYLSKGFCKVNNNLAGFVMGRRPTVPPRPKPQP